MISKLRASRHSEKLRRGRHVVGPVFGDLLWLVLALIVVTNSH